MRTITTVIVGFAFFFPSISVQAQKSEPQASRPASPAALIGLPSATVTTESPGLVATRIILARYTLPSPDPNLNDTFMIKMRIAISESGDVETAKVIKDAARDHGADELYAPALEAIRLTSASTTSTSRPHSNPRPRAPRPPSPSGGSRRAPRHGRQVPPERPASVRYDAAGA